LLYDFQSNGVRSGLLSEMKTLICGCCDGSGLGVREWNESGDKKSEGEKA
jgi:hypothetical protein